MKLAAWVMCLGMIPFSAGAQELDEKELSDFLIDFDIFRAAVYFSDSAFMEFFNEATDGYQEKEEFYRDLHWESAEKQLQLIYRSMDQSRDAIKRMIQQLNDWGFCLETIAILYGLEMELQYIQVVCNDIFKNSWGYYTVEDFVYTLKPKGDTYYKLIQSFYDHSLQIENGLNECFDE
ncbi:MAG: hypothetical protein ABR95_03030 [Sphingobacteriales bacterium BACL12 MAG-120813-bin55]|jgi:biotin operon repressor|nr:MAG: hypothetical protein ABR94_03710 [Sphingobacteriales bacterium BACL12 MAG-120802-bin5]KRP12537.1 MAG: hypothetical protein ABR95_03030 [Sphingobacteriales bacterium BACL12 MAG-120813-bin55]